MIERQRGKEAKRQRLTEIFSLLLVSLFLCFLTACATSFDAKGVYHRVRKGENLLWIAKSYGVELQDLAELNNIQKIDEELVPGQQLYIPQRRVSSFKKLPIEGEIFSELKKKPGKLKEEKPSKGKKITGEEIFTEHSRFGWPVEGNIISPFGIRHGRRHDGIDIKGAVGTPIKAADKGEVVYAGSMRGYGNLILIRHKGNFFTAYAHNKSNGVKEGKRVKKGQVIGLVGRTGRATGPHLHFEVREGEKARNPLFFLPVMR